ncbi:type II toxin-antitoxin system VapC family toxin [soil metagenome]
MRLLLDTHALLWVLTEPARMPDQLIERLSDPANELLVSAASAWECATKHRLGKLPGADAVLASFADHLANLGATEVPISTADALLAGSLNWAHRDPFDRVLAAQSIRRSVPLVSRDPVFSSLPGVGVLW